MESPQFGEPSAWRALSLESMGTRCCAWKNALATGVVKRWAIRGCYKTASKFWPPYDEEDGNDNIDLRQSWLILGQKSLQRAGVKNMDVRVRSAAEWNKSCQLR